MYWTRLGMTLTDDVWRFGRLAKVHDCCRYICFRSSGVSKDNILGKRIINACRIMMLEVCPEIKNIERKMVPHKISLYCGYGRKDGTIEVQWTVQGLDDVIISFTLDGRPLAPPKMIFANGAAGFIVAMSQTIDEINDLHKKILNLESQLEKIKYSDSFEQTKKRFSDGGLPSPKRHMPDDQNEKETQVLPLLPISE